MSRIKSTPTTIRVQSKVSLASEALTTASNSFRRFEGGGLTSQIPHPVSGVNVDVTQDGSATRPGQTAIDWASQGVYDPVTKRVQWMSKGVGNNPGDYIYNTLAIYDELTNSWSATRGYSHPNGSPKQHGSGHTYGNNCIDVAGRRHYKKQFTADSGFGSGRFYVYNLDTKSFEAGISPPGDDPPGAGFGPAEFIPTRGAAGRIWYANGTKNVGAPRITEYDAATGTGIGSNWSVVVPAGSFPLIPGNFSPSNKAGIMSYNPRAFGGAGGVMLAGASKTAYTIRLDTLAVNAVSEFSVEIGIPGNGRLCKEPNGQGWLLFVRSLGYIYRCDGMTWKQRAAIPSELSAAPAFIVVAIDDYGVVWIVKSRPSKVNEPRAWLYKP